MQGKDRTKKPNSIRQKLHIFMEGGLKGGMNFKVFLYQVQQKVFFSYDEKLFISTDIFYVVLNRSSFISVLERIYVEN